MKKTIFALSLLLGMGSLFAQSDSLEQQIANFDDPKAIIIYRGRNFLLDRFLADDFEKAKEIREYLTNKIEDETHKALHPRELIYLLFWEKDYEALLKQIKAIYISDSIRYYHYGIIKEYFFRDSHALSEGLEKKTKENRLILIEQIKETALDAETSDFLILFLNYFLVDYRMGYRDLSMSRDDLNTSADLFLATYPESEYETFIRNQVRFKYEPSMWFWGHNIFFSYGLFTKQLKTNYTNPFLLGVEVEGGYKKINFLVSFLASIGTKTKQERSYSEEIFKKKSSVSLFDISSTFGYNILENRYIRVLPFVGIGGMSIEPTNLEKYPELKPFALKMVLNYSAGASIDIKLFKRTNFLMYSPVGYAYVRIKYTYNAPQFAERYTGFSGNLHRISIGFGGLFRGEKRVY